MIKKENTLTASKRIDFGQYLFCQDSFPFSLKMSVVHHVGKGLRGHCHEPSATCGYSRCGRRELKRHGTVSINMVDYEGEPLWCCSFTCLWMAKYARGGDHHVKAHRQSPAFEAVYQRLLKTYPDHK